MSNGDHGLRVIFESSAAQEGNGQRPNPAIDIVAVHGLNFKGASDHAQATWTSGDRLWLRDFLPDMLSRPARVMLFSYNSSPARKTSSIKLDDHAKSLLQWLKIQRKNELSRPLVFVCHSLGGLLVKSALVEATLDQSYKSVLESTRVLVFFATPHQGGKWATLGDILSKIIRPALGNAKNDILEALKKESDAATRRFEQARHLPERCRVVSFFEGDNLGRAGIIVDKKSGTLGLPGSMEKQVAMDRDHSSICKFDSAENQACILALYTIVEQIDESLQLAVTNALWLVPRPVNPLFTGRDKEVETIVRAIKPNELNNRQRRFVLTAMGGQGKSEVCLKVAHTIRDQFWAVFWVDVSSGTVAQAGFSKIAEMLSSSGTSVNDALIALANLPQKQDWLLIVDNADDPDVDYNQYFPSGDRGAILVTSRNVECGEHQSVGSMELESLGPDHCVELLLKSAKVHESLHEEQFADALVVAEQLGYSTLALLQAGAFIHHTRCSIARFPDRFRRKKEAVLMYASKQWQSRHANVYATLEASMEYLESEKASLESSVLDDALELLVCFSNFHYGHIPVDIFEYAWMGAQRATGDEEDILLLGAMSIWHVSRLPKLLRPGDQPWDSDRLWEAIRRLNSLALVKMDTLNHVPTVSLHPLVHEWINIRQTPVQRKESLRMTQCVMGLSNFAEEDWAPYQRLLTPHLHHVLQKDRKITEESETSRPILQMCIMLSYLLYDCRLTQDLDYLVGKMHRSLGIEQDSDSPTTEFWHLYLFTAKNHELHGRKAKRIQVLKDMQRFVADERGAFEVGDVERLANLHELATAYLENNQVEDAIEAFERVLSEAAGLLKEDDQNRLTSQSQLARAYEEVGRTMDAIKLYREVVDIRKATLLDDHPLRLSSQHGLAMAIVVGGHKELMPEAISLLQETVKADSRSLREDDADRIKSQHWLAEAYLSNGQAEKAIDVLERIVRVEDAILAKGDDLDNPRSTRDLLARAHELRIRDTQSGTQQSSSQSNVDSKRNDGTGKKDQSKSHIKRSFLTLAGRWREALRR